MKLRFWRKDPVDGGRRLWLEDVDSPFVPAIGDEVVIHTSAPESIRAKVLGVEHHFDGTLSPPDRPPLAPYVDIEVK